MPTNLFRKVSLERLTSPEQLDKLLIIVKLRGWIALITILLITVAILVWSFIGQIPISASGKGILLDPRGLHGIYSRAEGRVTSIMVQTGDAVNKGQTLVVMDNSVLEVKRDELTHRIRSLKESLQNEIALHEEQKKLKEEEFKRKLELENLILENQKAKLAFFEKQLAQASPDKQESLEEAIMEQKALIQTQLASIDIFHAEQRIFATNERIDNLKNELLQNEGHLTVIQTELNNLIVRAPDDGQIIEIDVTLGKELSIGSPLIWIQGVTDKKITLPFYCFVPISMGEKIRKGMPAHISLIAIDQQKYGQIKGEVLEVLPYAASLSTQLIAGIPSRVLREYLSADPTALLVVIEPLKDPSTPTGYKWTTEKGPPIGKIPPGAIGEARIVLQSKRPITYVLPILTE